MTDSGKSERIERLEQQVNQRVRQAISGLHEEIRDRLRRAGDQIVSELDRELEGVAPDLPASFLLREELEPLTAEADSAGRHRALSDLVAALGTVDAARSQAAVLDALVRESGRFGARTAVLLARESGLELWGAQGWGAGSSGVEVAWEASGPWSQDSLGRGVGSLDAADCAPLCSQLEEALPAAAVLVPLVVLDRLGAVLYADRGADDELLTEALQILTWAAALALETLPFRNREATPTLRSAEEAGTALGVWSAPAVSPTDVAETEDDLLDMAAADAMAAGEETAETGQAPEDLPEDAAAGWTLEDEAGDMAASPAAEAPRAEVGDLEVGDVGEESGEIELEDGELEDDELEDDEMDLDEMDLDEAVEEVEETQAEPPRIAGFEAPSYPRLSDPAAEEASAAEGVEEEDFEAGDLDGADFDDGDLGEVDLYSDETDGELYAGDADDGGVAPVGEEAALEEEVAEAAPEGSAVESGFGASPATAAVPAAVEEDGGAETAAPEMAAVAEPAPAPVPPPPVAGAQVAPPQDLQGPGTAFGGGSAPPSGEQDARHEEARRLARLLVSEIRLYNEEEVEEGRRGRDIYQRLKDDIDRSRQMYEERVDPGIREETDYFYEELVRNLGDGDARTLGL